MSEQVDNIEVEEVETVEEVEQAEATATYIKSLMINPETAQFMADAGVSLSDSIDGIKGKMAKQSKIQEVIDTRNELIDAGYDISPVPVPGGKCEVLDVLLLVSEKLLASIDTTSNTRRFRRPQPLVISTTSPSDRP